MTLYSGADFEISKKASCLFLGFAFFFLLYFFKRKTNMALFYLNLRVFKFYSAQLSFSNCPALQEVPSSWHWLGVEPPPSLSLCLSLAITKVLTACRDHRTPSAGSCNYMKFTGPCSAKPSSLLGRFSGLQPSIWEHAGSSFGFRETWP